MNQRTLASSINKERQKIVKTKPKIAPYFNIFSTSIINYSKNKHTTQQITLALFLTYKKIKIIKNAAHW
jgi:hypothetical protein